MTSGAPLELISSEHSYVQHLRHSSGSPPSDWEDRLVRAASSCQAIGGVQLQTCSPDICGAERAFDVRIGVPAHAGRPAPSLRVCASAYGSCDAASLSSVFAEAFRTLC